MSSNTSYTLAQLQAMTRAELEAAFPMKHNVWVARGYKVDIQALLRSCILAVKELHYPITDNTACRERWYNPIKAIVLMADPERVNKPLKHGYMATFEAVLSKMVKAGEVTYSDLGINDYRTMKETFNHQVEKAKCWKDILLFVEKDSAYVHLESLTRLFNINIISGGGWAHSAGVERHLRELREKGIEEVVVFTVTDYDPFGMAIQTEFVSTCGKLGLEVKEHYRIGINKEHATPEILDVQKYPIKKGRKLSVNGVSFNSDEWLQQYGIEGEYGLEIEAISGQPGGHQLLREIVAKELLKYLEENDRVEELTARGWKEAPLHAIANFINSIDNSWPEEKEITTLPTELPQEFLTYKEYGERASNIEAEKESATEDIDGEISDLEDQMSDLETQKEDIEQPFDSRLGDLASDYLCSARLVMYSLYRYYSENRDKWPREKYSLGYPAGCILEAVKQQASAQGFEEHLDLHEIHDDLINAFHEIIKNGEFGNVLKKVWDDVQRNNGHGDVDSEGEG